jgi:hypothetical protein
MGETNVWRYLLGGAAVALFAVGRAIDASGREDVSWALAFGGFAVAAIAVGLLTRKPKQRRDATRRGCVRIDGAEVPALEIPISGAKTQLLVIGALGFTEAGVAIAYTGRVWVGAFAAVFFGGCALIGVRNLVSPPVVSLSERGVHWRSAAGQRWVPWDEVEYVLTGNVDDGGFLEVHASHGPTFEGRSLGRLFARAGRLGGAINIPINAVGIDPELLGRMIEELAEDPASRKGIADRGALATGPPGTARFSEL